MQYIKALHCFSDESYTGTQTYLGELFSLAIVQYMLIGHHLELLREHAVILLQINFVSHSGNTIIIMIIILLFYNKDLWQTHFTFLLPS